MCAFLPLANHQGQAMCMVVYIAAEQPLPLIPWNVQDRGFHVTALDGQSEVVRSQFSLPHVVYAGSHQGCGCGFQFGQHPELDTDQEELRLAHQSRHGLAEYLRSALDAANRIQIYACWSGDEGQTPLHRRNLTPKDIDSDGFAFEERELIDVGRDRPASESSGAR